MAGKVVSCVSRDKPNALVQSEQERQDDAIHLDVRCVRGAAHAADRHPTLDGSRSGRGRDREVETWGLHRRNLIVSINAYL